MNELSLLRGKYITIDHSIKVYPLTLDEIEEIGEDQYKNYLAVLNINKKLLGFENINDESQLIFNKISDFEFMLAYLYKSEEERVNMIRSLSLFLKEAIYFDEEDGLYIQRDNMRIVIDEDLFKKIKSTIYKQNYLSDSSADSTYKPANEKARKLAEKLAKIKGELTKENNKDGLNLRDVISIVASYSTDINILTIWDLTVYQLYEEYIRLQIWDNYHNDYIHLPHMDENDRKNLKHWAIDINKLNK